MQARPGKHLARIGLVAAWLVANALTAQAKVSVTPYWSHRNGDRPRRIKTDYIILHTTEGPTAGSLKKVHANGEAHYFIDAAGKIYGIIDRRRVALHAGRSMWRGRTNLDDTSIGIEVVGYHNRSINAAQIAALKALLSELQAIYGIPDDYVLTHSMVAYGAPNRWHRRSHRGRKRCAMILARTDVRRAIGLTDQPREDPDVAAGRLAIGDAYLARYLYEGARALPPAPPDQGAAPEAHVITANRSAWDIARDLYNDPRTRYLFPDGKERAGNEIRNWKQMPAGTRVVLAVTESENSGERVMYIGADGASAREIAGEEFDSARTVYFLKDGRVRTGTELSLAVLDALAEGTGMLVGYTPGGAITARRSAFTVCGVKWNHPSTFYRYPNGTLVPGDRVRENAIPKGSLVFFRN